MEAEADHFKYKVIDDLLGFNFPLRLIINRA